MGELGASSQRANSEAGNEVKMNLGPVLPFPRSSTQNQKTNAAAQRIHNAFQAAGRREPVVVPAEQITLIVADIPVRGMRAKRAALPFAIEEDIAVALEDVHVALCRPLSNPDRPDAVLAAVIDRRLMEGFTAPAMMEAAVIPETFAVPAPTSDPTSGPVWAIWRDGTRALVRTSDETGFAIQADMIEFVWKRAGRPTVLSYGAALPSSLGAKDLSDAPPPPNAKDLAVDLRQGVFAPASADWARPASQMAAIVALGLLLHLGLAWADLIALQGIAEEERVAAQDAVDPLLPGIGVDTDPAAIIARLAPPAREAQGSEFLTLLTSVSEALLVNGPQVSWRRIAYSDAPARIVILIEAPSLEDLQRAERVLQEAGLSVSSGVATAGDGAAEAEFQVSKRDGT